MGIKGSYTFRKDDTIETIEKIFSLDKIRGAKSTASRKAICALFDPELLGNRKFLSGVFSREIIDDIESGISIDGILERLEAEKLHGQKRKSTPKRSVAKTEENQVAESASKSVPSDEKKKTEVVESTGNRLLDEISKSSLPEIGKRKRKNEGEEQKEDEDGIVDMSGGFFNFD